MSPVLETDETRAATTSEFVENSWNRETVAEDARDPLVGVTLSDTYVVERVLGEGGMGRVYMARHTRIAQKRVAVKVLHNQYACNAQVLARFQREAEAAAAVSHPNVVTVLDVARTPQGQPYLVCEYLEGTDLAEHLRAVRKLDVPAALHITRQICRGLAAAHRSGVIHRDLKPQNVFLVGDSSAGISARPIVKILDFGLSRFLDPAPGDQLTQTGVILGTPSYMAPEQARARPVDLRADIYGVGAILYTALTGRPPYLEDTPHATILAVLHGEPPPPRSIEQSIPEALEAILLRALAREPENRFPDAEALERALDAYEARMGIDSLPPRVALLPEPVQAPALAPAPAPAPPRPTGNARLSFIVFLAASLLLFVSAAGTSIPGVELASGYSFNRVETILFLLAVTGTIATPAALWLVHIRATIAENGPELQSLAGRLRAFLSTFVWTYGLGAFGLALIDGCWTRLSETTALPRAGLSFAGWNLILPLLGVSAALGRLSLQVVAEEVRPGWRRALATASAGCLVLVLMASLAVAGLEWRERTLESPGKPARTLGDARRGAG